MSSSGGGNSTTAPSSAAPPVAASTESKEQLKAMKDECCKLYREPAYDEKDQEYILGEFRWSTRKILNVSDTQVYRGLADSDDKPHGWGLMQHHNGISQDNARWVHGVACGKGWFRDPEGGVFYGTWREGKRHGLGCSINKEGHMYVETYDSGKLLKRIKWKVDTTEHLNCYRCGTKYVEKTNKLECRYHPDSVNWEDRYGCCGAFSKLNPRGCAVDLHRVSADADLQQRKEAHVELQEKLARLSQELQAAKKAGQMTGPAGAGGSTSTSTSTPPPAASGSSR